MSRFSKLSIEQNHDFELNLAPIIDCFTVLIAFLLASASFLSFGMLEAGLAGGGAPSAQESEIKVQYTVEIKNDSHLNIQATGEKSFKDQINSKGGKVDVDSLSNYIKSQKEKYNDQIYIVLSADDSVDYELVVSTLETIKKVFPGVALGGF